MTRTRIWMLILTLALASAASAATEEEKCRQKKLIALGKRDLCLQTERAREVVGKASNPAKCSEKFEKAIAKTDEAAARRGVSCRWLENGDGTALDLDSGRQWEMKTDDSSIHDKDNQYTWCIDSVEDGVAGCDDHPLVSADGTAFTDFLATLNGGDSLDGVTTTGCFAGRCDWRMPTIEELASIAEPAFPYCPFPRPSPACTTIPREQGFDLHYTNRAFYWSSTSYATGLDALGVNFDGAYVRFLAKPGTAYVRAVRGGP